MDFEKLNKQQYAAATYNGKHLLVLAGAGTGKTRTIIARAIHLISEGVNPNRIKILSFTKKSASEIASRIRVEGSTIPQANQISGSTFHSWCMELIMRFGAEFGLEGYSCIDEDDRESAISIAIGNICNKKTLKIEDLKFDKSLISNIYSYAVNTKQNLSASIKAKLFPYASVEEVERRVRNIKEHIVPIIESYIEYKHIHKYIDYDDMLMAVAKILKQNTEIREYISSLYDHILIDEMQDTNPLQWMLIESFMKNCHLFCVGDDAQSIYGFRGADFKSIHSFLDIVPNSEVYKLEENYRSTQEILDISNWLLDESPLDYDKHLLAFRGKGEKPIMQYVDNEWEEAECITDNIISNIASNNKNYKDHMVLTRTAYGARQVEAVCISKKIPYTFYGGTTLMKSAHVRDVLSALRVLSNHKDELAWIRYLMLWEGVGEITASLIIEKMSNCSTFNECIDVIKMSKLKNKSALKLLENISEFRYNPCKAIDLTVEALEKILSKKYSDNWAARRKDFSVLKLVAGEHDNVLSFIAEYVIDPVAELSKIDPKDDNDKIVISTIHSAKGLEADICYVINVAPGMYPSERAKIFDDIEEERRCLYVAMTRAKDVLYLMARNVSTTAFRTINKEDECSNDDAFFFNGLPAKLVKKKKIKRKIQKGINGSNKKIKTKEPITKEFWSIDFT
ncbi:MAG: ATP-dependent helicase [Bacteroidales bacterium]|nr:ATP-dependent helicase [Bacteroidales bacterium]